jgi:thiamine-monophosphate kinase
MLATFPAATALPDPWRVLGRVAVGQGVTVDGAAWAGAEGWEHF